jgi:hypothetical protein
VIIVEASRPLASTRPAEWRLPWRLALRWAVITAIELLSDLHVPQSEVGCARLLERLRRAVVEGDTGAAGDGHPAVPRAACRVPRAHISRTRTAGGEDGRIVDQLGSSRSAPPSVGAQDAGRPQC